MVPSVWSSDPQLACSAMGSDSGKDTNESPTNGVCCIRHKTRQSIGRAVWVCAWGCPEDRSPRWCTRWGPDTEIRMKKQSNTQRAIIRLVMFPYQRIALFLRSPWRIRLADICTGNRPPVVHLFAYSSLERNPATTDRYTRASTALRPALPSSGRWLPTTGYFTDASTDIRPAFSNVNVTCTVSPGCRACFSPSNMR
jgi:hypothetical protein